MLTGTAIKTIALCMNSLSMEKDRKLEVKIIKDGTKKQ
jgi:hypothetical protein